MKLHQHLCLNEILHILKNGSRWVKNSVTRSNLGITLSTPYRPHFQSDNRRTWSEFALMKSWMSLKMGHVVSNTRSLNKILEKPYVRCRGHIFSQIIMKLGQNFCLDEISENGSCRVKI